MGVHSGFQPSCEVTEPQLLFGHNAPGRLLDRVIGELLLGTNSQIVGERRSGKTSLLKTCVARLEREIEDLIPVYLNYREHHGIQGYAAAHRLLLAHLHALVVSKGRPELPNAFQMRGVKLLQEGMPEAVYESLMPLTDYRIDGLLETYLRFLSSEGIGVALLIDEYEHLMRYTFGAQEGAFSHLRALSSEPAACPGSPKPLTYVVAGALTWDQLCGVTGSPELNNISALLYIEPLDSTTFREMWEQCLSDSSPAVRQSLLDAKVDSDEAYDLSGGWPFYGKVIGHHLGTGHPLDTCYEALLQHFGIIWGRLTALDRRQLRNAPGSAPGLFNPAARDLMRRGLLEAEPDGQLRPCGRLWQRFLQEQLEDWSEEPSDGRTRASGQPHQRLTLIVDDIAQLVTEINETSLNICGKEVFGCSNQDVQTYRDLRQPSIAADSFGQFSLSLYNLVFERTKGPRASRLVEPDSQSVAGTERIRPLERLPQRFRRNCIIVRVVDAVRHHFGKGHLTRLAHFNTDGSGVSISKVLSRYLGHKAHPESHEYLQLQLGILRDLVQYLRELRDHVRQQAQVET